MSTADDPRHIGENLLFPREELASDIASILKGDAHSPEALAHLCIILRNAIVGGLEGINRASDTLAAVVELTFTHSRAHAAALRLHLLSQEGLLRVEDEPVRLINAAIERSTAGARAGKAPGREKRGAAERRFRASVSR
ncbi:MAG TPA: hypothetical protein VHU19_17045 [Pyrinomonadaceae bacterium]|jgi:hypothetical protein|nr:hypothetical protein [Pyrinomonadaceae bacterium]